MELQRIMLTTCDQLVTKYVCFSFVSILLKMRTANTKFNKIILYNQINKKNS